MENFICKTCGVEYAESESPPERCPICEDPRQDVGWAGQEWAKRARRTADGAPLGHRGHRKFLDRLADPTQLSDAEKKECFACFDTEDFRTGYQAFLDKKKPEFKGR